MYSADLAASVDEKAAVNGKAAHEHVSLSAALGRAKLLLQADGSKLDFKLTILECGSCEALKLGVHAATLALAVVMSAYNAAAWYRRRKQHLAVNAVVYSALIALEQHHVAHHLALLRQPGCKPE